MSLHSYSIFGKRKKKKRRDGSASDFIWGVTSAIIGLAIVSETAKAFNH